MKILACSILLVIAVFAGAPCTHAQAAPEYVAPTNAVPHGSAPGMWVKVLNSGTNGPAEYAVVFRPGDDPWAGLTQFAADYHVPSAHFTGIGAFRDARLGWFDAQKKQYRVIPVDQQVEVASLVGDIAQLDGKPSVHMHCVLSMSDGQTRGGHFLSAHVYPLLEVFVTVDPTPLGKKRDPDTGLSLMDPGTK